MSDATEEYCDFVVAGEDQMGRGGHEVARKKGRCSQPLHHGDENLRVGLEIAVTGKQMKLKQRNGNDRQRYQEPAPHYCGGSFCSCSLIQTRPGASFEACSKACRASPMRFALRRV